MRHAAAVTKRSLPGPMALSPVGCALVPATRLTSARPVAEIPTFAAAVAMPAVVRDTDVKRHTAVEALDLDDVDRTCASHAKARRISTTLPASARLYPSRGRASTSLRRLPGRPFAGRPGPSTSPTPSVPPPDPPTPRLRRGL
jgi:hypothetical protein